MYDQDGASTRRRRKGCMNGESAWMTRIAIALIVVAVAALLWFQRDEWFAAKDASPTDVSQRGSYTSKPQFWCYRVPKLGYAERECAIRQLSQCGAPIGSPDDCFRQEHAFCFYTEHVSGGKQYACLVTQPECESWNRIEVEVARDRGNPVGPCLRMTADDPSLRELMQ
jgi:hypothetical protein